MLEALRNATGGWFAKIFIALLVWNFSLVLLIIFGMHDALNMADITDSHLKISYTGKLETLWPHQNQSRWWRETGK